MEPNKVERRRTYHVVVMPYPGRGHINPMMNLCKLLSSRKPGFLFTFVLTEEWYGFICSDEKPDDVLFRTIPNVIPSESGRTKDFHGFLKAVATKMEAPFEQLLDQLERPVDAIISDTYLDWVVNVGNRRNIPVASLWPMSAIVFSIFHHFQLLVQNNHFPVDLSERGRETVDYIPGVSSMRLADLPSIFYGTSRELLPKALEPVSMVSKAQYLLFTSIYELEAPVIDVLRTKFPFPVYPIGAALPCIDHGDDDSPVNNGNQLSSREEDWLSQFSDLHPWRAEDKCPRRACWVSLENLPVQGWQEATFKNILRPFGRLLAVDPKSASLERLDEARCFVATEQTEGIEGTVLFDLGGIKYKVFVKESLSWDLPWELLQRDFKVSTGGLDSFQSPICSAFIPRRKSWQALLEKNDKVAGSPMTVEKSDVHRGSKPSSPAGPAHPGPLHLSLDPVILGSENAIPPCARPSSDGPSEPSHQTLAQFLKNSRQRKHSVSRSNKSQRAEGTAGTATCSRRISFDPLSRQITPPSPSGLFLRLSRKYFDKKSRRRRRANIITVENSLQSKGSRQSLGPVADSAVPLSSTVVGETGNTQFLNHEDSTGESPDELAREDEMEAKLTLELLNHLGLSTAKSNEEILEKLKLNIAAEREEWRSHAET